MFWLLLSSAYTSQELSDSHILPTRRRTRSWEGTQPGQVTWTSHRDIPYHRMSCSVYELEGVGWEPPITAGGLAGHRSVAGEQLCVANHFVFLGLIPVSFSLSSSSSLLLLLWLLLLFVVLVFIITINTIIISYLVLNCSYLSTEASLFSLLSSLAQSRERGSERAAAWYLVAGRG